MYDTLMADPKFSTGNFLILPMHSMEDILKARSPQPRKRKIFLATKNAETNLMIDDLVCIHNYTLNSTILITLFSYLLM